MLEMAMAFEWVSLLVALFCFKKFKLPVFLRFFPFFLFVTVTFEAFGHYLLARDIVNYTIFNFFGIFEFSFYSFVLYHIITNTGLKAFVLYAVLIYMIVALAYNFIEFKNRFHSLIYVTGSALTVCFSCFYFYGLFRTPTSRNPARHPGFWICFGLLFYYSCTIPIYTFSDFIAGTIFEVYSFILGICNYLLYTCFTIAFICFLRSHKIQVNG